MNHYNEYKTAFCGYLTVRGHDRQTLRECCPYFVSAVVFSEPCSEAYSYVQRWGGRWRVTILRKDFDRLGFRIVQSENKAAA